MYSQDNMMCLQNKVSNPKGGTAVRKWWHVVMIVFDLLVMTSCIIYWVNRSTA